MVVNDRTSRSGSGYVKQLALILSLPRSMDAAQSRHSGAVERRSLPSMTEIPKAGQGSFEKALADIKAATAALTEAKAILEADDIKLDAASHATIERDAKSIFASIDAIQARIEQQRKSSR